MPSLQPQIECYSIHEAVPSRTLCSHIYIQVEIDELRAEVERVTALHDELLSKAQRGELELGAVSAEHAAEIEAERARQAAAHERRVEHLTEVHPFSSATAP